MQKELQENSQEHKAPRFKTSQDDGIKPTTTSYRKGGYCCIEQETISEAVATLILTLPEFQQKLRTHGIALWFSTGGPIRCVGTPGLPGFQESQHDGLNMRNYEIEYKNMVDSILIQISEAVATLRLTLPEFQQKLKTYEIALWFLMGGPIRCVGTPGLFGFQESQHDGLNMRNYEIEYKNGVDSILIQSNNHYDTFLRYCHVMLRMLLLEMVSSFLKS
ncbi:hypothetical protein Tco_0158055 [Tanacetum coccineum]